MTKPSPAIAMVLLTLGQPALAQEQQAFESAERLAEPGTQTNAAAFAEEVSRQRTSEGERTGSHIDARYTESLAEMLRRFDALIWNGTRVPEGQFMDAVAVTGNGGLCSGTLIAPAVVLTAAHCICDYTDSLVWFGTNIRDRRAVLSVPVARSKSYLPCGTADVSAADIGVLFLEMEMQNVAPRRIAPLPIVQAAASVRAVGFGKTENPATEPSGIKRQVDILIQSHDCSARGDPAAFGCSPPELVARQPLQSRDTCGGDSGGPIYVDDGSGEFLLAGATSRAVATEGARVCGDGGIYTIVSHPTYQQFFEDSGVTIP